jgi:hypothetical protein
LAGELGRLGLQVLFREVAEGGGTALLLGGERIDSIREHQTGGCGLLPSGSKRHRDRGAQSHFARPSGDTIAEEKCPRLAAVADREIQAATVRVPARRRERLNFAGGESI